MAEGDCNSSGDVCLSGALKNDHTNIQALFRRYLASRTDARPAIVQEILSRLQSHLEMEESVLLEAIHASGSHALDLVEDVILEHEEIQAMFHELQRGPMEDDDSWEERFEDMMQTVSVHFVTEERDLLPLVDRARDV